MTQEGRAEVFEEPPVDATAEPKPASAPPGRRPPTAVGSQDEDDADSSPPRQRPYLVRVLEKMRQVGTKSRT